MDVEGIRQELAHGRSSAGVVDGLGVAGPEEPVVGQSAGVCVAAEERPDITPETEREGRDRRTSPESPEGQVDEQVFGVSPRDGVPVVGPRHALDQGEGPLERAEPGIDLGGLREFIRLRQPPEARGCRPGEWTSWESSRERSPRQAAQTSTKAAGSLIAALTSAE